MKRVCFILLFFLIVYPCLANVVEAEGYAYSGGEITEDIQGRWDAFYSSLPEDVRSELDFSLDYDATSLESLLEKADIGYWWGKIKVAVLTAMMPGVH